MDVYIAVIHHPVYDRGRRVVATAITNFDLHDISRVAKTYGIKRYYVVCPIESQIWLANRIIDYWRNGPGASYNDTRRVAFETISVRTKLPEVVEEITSECGTPPKIVATTARERRGAIGYDRLRAVIFDAPHLILFGTGWGLVDEIIEGADFVLAPIKGRTDYNHLSVRSAVSIILDRLLGER
ncbi:MAG: RNA methyltransferase [bacterium]